ncbi:uncharacterized protein LOC124449676 isoform X2 [Xenia sp. Carnegie-2017]|uniref:uncharacterized protein LOC124449676 isoform X2 n=1 Tax=Xenia sp. Carnegie-2017 TaxID=2897299 RepID=UPI001F04B79C|nr:uncharacterized protein LOC124449676 isoform X2 [Xenia sp. Carnegie-2017]
MMLIWHPDKPNGNKEIAEKIIHAKEILLNDEYRAQYHNHFDYQQGWFSLKRWKAIFLSECGSVKQHKAFWKRLGFLVFSSLLAVGGITCSVLTAGLGAPVFVTLGSIAGGALFGAGLQSSGECLKERSVIDGMDSEKWIKKALIGGAAGVFVGGASAGITAGIVGIGNAALSSSAVSIGKFIGMGAANGGIGGIIMSLSSILSRKLVDKENIALKKVIIHALLGGLIGATAGIAAGAVTKPLVDGGSSAAAPTIEGDLIEQAFLRTTGQNTVKLLRLVGKRAAILASRVAIEKSYDAAYELVDSSAKS